MDCIPYHDKHLLPVPVTINRNNSSHPFLAPHHYINHTHSHNHTDYHTDYHNHHHYRYHYQTAQMRLVVLV